MPSAEQTLLAHTKRMRIRAIRLHIELCNAELDQLIMEEPTSLIRDKMTEANIGLMSATHKLKSVGEQLD